MKANILNPGGFDFMKGCTFPLTVECELSPSEQSVRVTPSQLTQAGVPASPSRFFAPHWSFFIPTEAVIIEE
jgi:hypothetical protein